MVFKWPDYGLRRRDGLDAFPDNRTVLDFSGSSGGNQISQYPPEKEVMKEVAAAVEEVVQPERFNMASLIERYKEGKPRDVLEVTQYIDEKICAYLKRCWGETKYDKLDTEVLGSVVQSMKVVNGLDVYEYHFSKTFYLEDGANINEYRDRGVTVEYSGNSCGRLYIVVRIPLVVHMDTAVLYRDDVIQA